MKQIDYYFARFVDIVVVVVVVVVILDSSMSRLLVKN